jgi:MoxR-like ATPase
MNIQQNTPLHLFQDELANALQAIGNVILGKQEQIKLVLSCLLAGGHCLIEDQPGVGKTTLAHTIAQVMGLDFARIQFTSDLLPADILGVSIFNRDSAGFEFHAGPIFANCVLADEINRATPKTQSALLEAMEEHQVTIEGETRGLPEPFFVIATQNPLHQIGTYPLPESQLDRFLMCIDLGYPDKAAERQLLEGQDRRQLISQIPAAFSPARLIELQDTVRQVTVSSAILDYIQSVLDFSRNSRAFEYGLSPRGGLALLNAARAYAYLSGSGFILPEHVQSVMPAVVNHRLAVQLESEAQAVTSAAEYIIESIPVH